MGVRPAIDEARVIGWLLEGDPAIRWQVLRDLSGADAETVAQERARVAIDGWGARLLTYQDPDGRWGGQLYGSKWLSTTDTLLLLRLMGLDPEHPKARRACRELLDGGYRPDGGLCYTKTTDRIDLGVMGMVLSILAHFGDPDERVHTVAGYLLDKQLSDGRWEPFAGNRRLRYTFDGTLLVLEGLREYETKYPRQSLRTDEAQRRGREFLLSHRLCHAGATPEIVDRKMLLCSFPPRWYYDILAALDYFRACQVEADERLGEALTLLRSKRNRDGTWNLQNRHAGKTFFEMEDAGRPSRWNTLRALRVLRWGETRRTR